MFIFSICSAILDAILIFTKSQQGKTQTRHVKPKWRIAVTLMSGWVRYFILCSVLIFKYSYALILCLQPHCL